MDRFIRHNAQTGERSIPPFPAAANRALINPPPSMAKKPKNPLLRVDDHPIVRQGLAELIDHEKDLSVCGVAEDIHKALDQIAALTPDLVIVDISLKGSNGIELLKNIKVRYPRQVVLMLSMHDES